jgi:hypothetical protein
VNGEPGRGRLSPALLVAGLVLGLDAIACQLLALVLTLFSWFRILPVEMTSDVLVPGGRVAGTALLALWCPVAATLVAGVRTRAARLTGLTTAALLAAGGAAVAAGILGLGTSRQELVVGIVVVALNVVAAALLVTPPAAARPPVPAEPAPMIDLGAR